MGSNIHEYKQLTIKQKKTRKESVRSIQKKPFAVIKRVLKVVNVLVRTQKEHMLKI
jgi:hypothetical protein